VLQGLGLLPPTVGDARVTTDEQQQAQQQQKQQGAAMQEAAHLTAQQRRAPLHIGVSFGGAVVIDLANVAPEAVRGAVLMVPGGLMPGRHATPCQAYTANRGQRIILAEFAMLPHCEVYQSIPLTCILTDEQVAAAPESNSQHA
jgi:pimeloyl-ACP methyl ester carboxylesterase